MVSPDHSYLCINLKKSHTVRNLSYDRDLGNKTNNSSQAGGSWIMGLMAHLPLCYTGWLLRGQVYFNVRNTIKMTAQLFRHSAILKYLGEKLTQIVTNTDMKRNPQAQNNKHWRTKIHIWHQKIGLFTEKNGRVIFINWWRRSWEAMTSKATETEDNGDCYRRMSGLSPLGRSWKEQ